MNKRIFKDQTSESGEVPFFKIGTFGKKPDSFISKKLFDEYKSKYPYPEVGDILISASGSIGRTVVYEGEDAYFQDSNIVWLEHDGRLKNSFLEQFLKRTKWNKIEGSTIKRLYNKDILNKKINLPKLKEQEKIGQLFQYLDKTITLHEEKQHQLERLKKALLQKMFADETGYPALRFKGFTEKWEQVEFRKLGIISRGLTYRPNDVTDKNGVRVLRSSNIYEDSFVLNDNDVFVNSSVVNVPNLKNGDILVTSANGSSRLVGKHAIIKGLSSKTVHGGFMLAIRPATNSYFLNSLMSTSWYDNFISTFVSGGNGSIGNLKKSDLEQQSIFIPLNKEQNKIGDVFYNLDKTITLHDKKIQYLKQLKRGLLQKMFV